MQKTGICTRHWALWLSVSAVDGDAPRHGISTQGSTTAAADRVLHTHGQDSRRHARIIHGSRRPYIQVGDHTACGWRDAIHKLNEIFEMFSKKCLLHLFSEFYKSRRSVFELYKSQRSVFEVLIWWFLVYPACDKNLLDRALVYKISVKSLRKISQRFNR